MLKSITVFVFAVIVVFVTQDSLANSEAYKEKLKNIQNSQSVCLDKAEATADMIDCLSKSHGELDALLNESYRFLRNVVKEDKVYYDALKTEQLAWIKLNKAIIDNIFKTGGGGSLDRVNAVSVTNQLLVNRIELFISLLPEHD